MEEREDGVRVCKGWIEGESAENDVLLVKDSSAKVCVNDGKYVVMCVFLHVMLLYTHFCMLCCCIHVHVYVSESSMPPQLYNV